MLLLIVSHSFHQSSAQTFADSSVITAVRVSNAPKLDGSLTDEVWREAIPISRFTQRETHEGDPATERTEVRIVYDDHALYVAASCYDSTPSAIIADEWKRDFNYGIEDNFELILDTYHDGRSGLLLVTNPNGARYDALVTDEGRDINSDWNGLWDARSTMTDQGWFVEIEIPFSTLRFNDDSVQVWGVNFERNIRRKREQVLWQGFLRNYELEQVSKAGTLIGLRTIQRGSDFELRPYVSGGIQRGFAPFSDERSTLTKTGLDMKYPISQSLTMDVTLNTDFAQVESDRAQINLTRFPLFFPEKREFFLEGAGTFADNFGGRPVLFYSRRIGVASGGQIPIIAGARLVGKTDSYSIGVLNMQTAEKDNEPTTNYAAFRLKKDILGQSYIGVLATNKQSPGRYNRVYGADANLRFSNLIQDNTLVVGGAVAGSSTPSMSGNNLSYRLFVDYPNDFIDHFIGVRSVEENFNPEVGFVDRRGKQLSWAFYVMPRPGIWGIQQLVFKPVDVAYYWDVNGVPETAVWEWRPLGFTTESGEFFEFNVQRNFDRLPQDFEFFNNTTLPLGRYFFTHYELQFETNSSRPLSGQFFYNWGDYYNGTRKVLSVASAIRATSRLSLSADYTRNDISLGGGSFVTHEVGGRINYAFSTLLNGSMFAQWNNEDDLINLNLRVHWIPEIGSDCYLVYNQTLDTTGKVRPSVVTVLAKIAYRFVL
jgi:hypothetical protein